MVFALGDLAMLVARIRWAGKLCDVIHNTGYATSNIPMGASEMRGTQEQYIILHPILSLVPHTTCHLLADMTWKN
jgi:hypothetical protein